MTSMFAYGPGCHPAAMPAGIFTSSREQTFGKEMTKGLVGLQISMQIEGCAPHPAATRLSI